MYVAEKISISFSRLGMLRNKMEVCRPMLDEYNKEVIHDCEVIPLVITFSAYEIIHIAI